MKPKISKKLAIIILFFFILLSYGNIFDNKFLWDDEAFIIDNPDIRIVSNIPKFFVYPDYGVLYRPLKSTLLTITYKVWGINKFGYHLNGFLLHLFSTILIFFISSSLLKSRWPAFLVAAIFAVHPIHTERVTGMTASFDLLGIVFYLLSFLLYLKYKESQNQKFLYSSLFTFGLSLLSSEEAITLPILILCYEIIFGYNAIKDALSKIKILFRKTIAFFSILIFYLIIRFLVLGHIARNIIPITGSFYSTILTMPKVIILKYILLLVFPINLSLKDTMPFSSSIFDFRVIISIIIIVALIYYALSSRNKVISFSLLWFFITLIPFYNIIPIDSLYTERYLYLPSFTVSVLFSLLIFKVKEIKKLLPILLAILLVSSYCFLTISRNKDWQNAEVLWKKTIQTSPDFAVAYNNLGMVYLNQGRDKESLKLFMKAIELKPDYSHPYNNIGILYKKAGNYSLALAYYKKAIALEKDYYEAYYNLGILYNKLEEYDLAIPQFIRALEIRPTYAKAHNNLGVALMNKGEVDEAISEFKKALSIDPRYEQASNNLVFAYSYKKV